MDARFLLLLGGGAAIAIIAWLLLSGSPKSEECSTPRSYDVICGDIIYREISESSMSTVLRVMKNCTVIRNC